MNVNQSTLNAMEIHFHPSGNSILGSYSTYRQLETAIERKSVPPPFGYCIKGEIADVRRLTEHVSLFGYCIRRLAGWRKACELSGTTIELSEVSR